MIKFVSDLLGRWFSPGPPVSSTNKTDRHDMTEILLKVAFNTIKQTNKLKILFIQDPGLFRVQIRQGSLHIYIFHINLKEF